MVALDVVHHQVKARVACVADVGGGYDVGVANARGQACLIEEHRDELVLVR